jgi:hypothetical protein
MVQISNEHTVAEPGNVYLLKDETFNKLDKGGNYIEPINLYVYAVESRDLDDVISMIQKDERFHISVSERSDLHAKLDVEPV